MMGEVQTRHAWLQHAWPSHSMSPDTAGQSILMHLSPQTDINSSLTVFLSLAI